MKVFKDFHLYLIGAVVFATALIFSCYPINAESGTGNWHYADVIDSWGEVGVRQYQGSDINSRYYVINYAGYSHAEITITTDSDNAFGAVTIYGKTYPYSGKVTSHVEASTKITWQVRTNTYDPGTITPSSSPPFNVTDTRGSFTYTTRDNINKFSGISFLGTTSDYVNHTNLDTSVWRLYDKNTYVYLGNVNLNNYLNDVWYFEIPIGNVTISKDKIHLYMYSTWNNKLNNININEDYLFQVKDKMFYYFTLNNEYHAWPYGQGDLYLQVDVDGASVLYNTFNLYHVTQFTDEWYEYLNYIKTWNYYYNTNKVQEESTQLDNSTNNLNDKLQELNTFEETQTEQFNQALNDIDMDFDISTEIPSFTNTLSYFKDVNELVFEQIPIVKYIILIILIVLLWGLLT